LSSARAYQNGDYCRHACCQRDLARAGELRFQFGDSPGLFFLQFDESGFGFTLRGNDCFKVVGAILFQSANGFQRLDLMPCQFNPGVSCGDLVLVARDQFPGSLEFSRGG